MVGTIYLKSKCDVKIKMSELSCGRVLNSATGTELAAAAKGDNFLPAGFTEFAGWADSAKKILPLITHKGDNLMADEEDERFDAGAEASWATRKHRSFMIHAVAAAAARATCRAVVAESKRRPAARPVPATKLFATLRRAGRNSLNAAMHRLLPHTVP